MSLNPGERLGPYEVVALIGSGGMAEVYKGRDSRLGRFVAIKVLNAPSGPFAQQPELVLQEARAASALNHPNIVTIHDVGRHADHDFLVMEYVAGRTLEEMLAERALTTAEALRYAIQIASALERAHSAGILHRDLKPGNIRVTSDGATKLVDFGLAKLIDLGPVPTATASAGKIGADAKTQASVTRVFAGSPPYMSPEQAQSLPVDARSDLFSFGSVLYEMVTGTRAFPGDAPSALRAVIATTPRRPSDINGGLPPALDGLLVGCLNKDPASRPASMTDVKRRLESVYEDAGYQAATQPARAPLLTLGRPSWALATVLLALIGAGWMIWRAWPTNERSATPRPLTTIPVTTETGSEIQPSLSPDGRQVAFVSNAADGKNSDVYVKVVESTAPALRLTSHPDRDVNPAWSPDGRWILFVRRNQAGRAQVMRVASLGGPETSVTAACDAADQFLSWSPDSAWFACHGTPQEPGIYQVALSTGTVTRLTQAPAGLVDTQAAVSPTGDRVIFLRGPATGLVIREVFQLELNADGTPKGSPRLIIKPPLPPFRYMAWMPDGREAIIGLAQAEGLGTKLYRFLVTESSQTIEQMDVGDASAFEPTMSRNGRRLIFTEQELQLDVWRSTPDVIEQHPLTSTRLEFDVEYSPDERRVAFISDRSGRDELWVAEADGSRPVQLTDMGAVAGPRWSPDGRTIAVVVIDLTTKNSDVFFVSSDGGAPRKVTGGTGSNSFPSFSRDGKYLYFTSSRTGRDEIHKMALVTDAVEQLTREGGLNAVETLDGSRIIYQKRQAGGGNPRRELWQISRDGGQDRSLGLSVPYGTFAMVKGGLLFLPWHEYSSKQGMLSLYDLNSGTATAVRTIPGPIIGMTATKDAQTILLSLSRTRFDLVRVDQLQ